MKIWLSYLLWTWNSCGLFQDTISILIQRDWGIPSKHHEVYQVPWPRIEHSASQMKIVRVTAFHGDDDSWNYEIVMEIIMILRRWSLYMDVCFWNSKWLVTNGNKWFAFSLFSALENTSCLGFYDDRPTCFIPVINKVFYCFFTLYGLFTILYNSEWSSEAVHCFRRLVGLLGRGTSPSQRLCPHSRAQHRKAWAYSMLWLGFKHAILVWAVKDWQLTT